MSARVPAIVRREEEGDRAAADVADAVDVIVPGAGPGVSYTRPANLSLLSVTLERSKERERERILFIVFLFSMPLCVAGFKGTPDLSPQMGLSLCLSAVRKSFRPVV